MQPKRDSKSKVHLAFVAMASLALLAAGCGDETVPIDADGDFILNTDEGSEIGANVDMDEYEDWLDHDSDGDGIADAIEAGDEDLTTPPRDTDGDGAPDFRDADSDGDGIPDSVEDPNGNGVVDPCLDPASGCESSNLTDDTDGDGIPDLIEQVAGTDPTDSSSVIGDGDFYFILPYEGDPDSGPLDFRTDIRVADIFFSVDTTGSFGEEILEIQNSISTIMSGVTAVIEEAQFGVGRFEDYPLAPFGLATDRPIELLQTVTDDVALLGMAVNALPPAAGGSDVPEAGMEALYQWATGIGIPEVGIPPFGSSDTIGGAAFRAGSLPIIIQITDAISHPASDYTSVGLSAHDQTATENALEAIGARVIGIRSIENDGDMSFDPRDELESIALATGATMPPNAMNLCETGIGAGTHPPVNPGSGDICPLVFDVGTDGAGLGGLIVDSIRDLTDNSELDISAAPVGGNMGLRGEILPGTSTTADFITSITPVTVTPAGGWSIDGDIFRDVAAGSTATFNVNAYNDFVRPLSVPQLFELDIRVIGDAVTVLDVRNVYIVVPEELVQIVIP